LGDRPVYRTRLIWTEKVVWASFVGSASDNPPNPQGIPFIKQAEK